MTFCYTNFQAYLIKLFITSQLYSTVVFYAPFILTKTFLCLAMSWTPFYLIWLTRMILDFTWPKNSFLSKLNWKHSYPSLCNMEAELYPTPTLLDTSIVDSTTEEVHQKLVSDTLHCMRRKYTVILVLMFYLFCWHTLLWNSCQLIIQSMCSSRWLYQVQNGIILFMSSIG